MVEIFMKAKFINESIEGILKPKNETDISRELRNMSRSDLYYTIEELWKMDKDDKNWWIFLDEFADQLGEEKFDQVLNKTMIRKINE